MLIKNLISKTLPFQSHSNYVFKILTAIHTPQPSLYQKAIIVSLIYFETLLTSPKRWINSGKNPNLNQGLNIEASS